MNNQEAEVILKINDKQAQEKFEKLESKAKDLRQQFAEAFSKGDTRAIESINKKLQQTTKEMNNMRTNAANIRAALVNLDKATPRELQRTIKLINNELNSGRVQRGSKEWDFYIDKLKETQAELKKVKAEMAVVTEDDSLFDKIKDGINDWGATAAAATAAFAGVIMSGKAAVQAYADMEAEEANVRKFTGMTAEEVARLNAEFKKMDTRTARDDLNKLAQEAGRLGKSSQEDVLGFVKAADQINVALDDLGQDATLKLSKLTGIFGDEKIYGTEQSLLKVGSVINELSQNCSASAPFLAEFSSRLGGIAAQSKMSISQVMAFGAVIDTMNLPVEAASTAMGQLITKIYQDPAKIAKAARLDIEEFKKTINTDMNTALLQLFEQLNKFGGMNVLATVFDDMGTDGARAIPVLSNLAEHIDELRWQQGEANKAFQEGISITNEFNVQNNTVQAQLDKARKGFTEKAVSLGEKLLPILRSCISGTSMLMRVMNVLVDFLINHTKTVLTLTAAIVAYNIAIKAATIAQTAHTAAVSLGNIALKGLNAITTFLTAGIALMTGNTTKATAAWRLFNMTIKSNPIGLVVSLLATAATALGAWISKNRQASEEERRIATERKKEQDEFRKGLTDLSAASAQYSSKEVTRLKQLYNAATNVHKSQESRVKAAKELQTIYPNTFNNLKTEEILAGNAADAYLRLAQNIKEVARAEAARDKLRENENTKISLELDNDSLADTLADKERQLEALEKRISGLRSAASGSPEKARELKAAKEAYNQLADEIADIDMQRAINHDKMEEVNKANVKLQQIADNAVASIENLTPDKKSTEPYIKEETEKERRERLKKAKEALKQELDERKSLFDQAEAQNLTLYVTGQKNYLQYCEERERMESQYADDVVAIHERHNKLDIAAYGAALKKKAEILKKHQDDEDKKRLKSSLNHIENNHKENTNDIVASFYDPESSAYQNKKDLNQKLLIEDISYLAQKQKLYKEDSEEYAALQRQIEERVAQDQLDKKKETAEALAAFEQQYRKGSGSQREKMEIEILADLHRQGLISEEEYQRAIRDIKDKYRDEDHEKSRKVQSEYYDMVYNLYTSFSDLFENLSKEGSNFWEDLSKAGEAAFAVMGAMLSQYSAYANAERDAEVAKIERRYDKEIAAAGKNDKKKKKLEEKKEAEIAKVKKKYNDKAMKIELAQAFASTALAAINAYASASKVNWLLGPIAAALATAAGMMQVATIRKQHEAEAAGYYSGGFTDRDPDNRKEVGVVHANEFVMNHTAVANPALVPVMRLIDHAQRNNTVGSLTSADVSRAIGQSPGVGAGGVSADSGASSEAFAGAVALVADTNASTRSALDRLSDNLEAGIEAHVIMDGEQGFYKRLKRYERLTQNPKR